MKFAHPSKLRFKNNGSTSLTLGVPSKLRFENNGSTSLTLGVPSKLRFENRLASKMLEQAQTF